MENTTRRLAALSAGITAMTLGCTTPHNIDADVDMLVQRSKQSNTALMRGDIERYRAIVQHSDDFTLMSPFGGPTTRLPSNERWKAIGKTFKNGTFEQELVQAYGTRDMVVLALIERTNVEVSGLPAQDWALRVTLVYRREGHDWHLAHRHADPLVEKISLQRSAALASGRRPDES